MILSLWGSYYYLANGSLRGIDNDLSSSRLDLDVLADADEDPDAKAWSTHDIKFRPPKKIRETFTIIEKKVMHEKR